MRPCKIWRLQSGHSAIEAALSEVRRSLLGLQAARESANRAKRELMELAAEVRSVYSASEAALEGLSWRADGTQELLSRGAAEVAALLASALERLTAEVAALRGRSEEFTAKLPEGELTQTLVQFTFRESSFVDSELNRFIAKQNHIYVSDYDIQCPYSECASSRKDIGEARGPIRASIFKAP
jgi:ABC-type transporter Mla subunit MlaD